MASTTGGGATHIATSTGILRDLSASNLIIVSGGGGGASENSNGADAGGISGSGANSGNQTTGYMFGQGEYSLSGAGGGGGLYGGHAENGAGSGYIKDTIGALIKQNKKMVGYDVPTSIEVNTKTESNFKVSANAARNSSKMGNGFVKIKRLEKYPVGCRTILTVLDNNQGIADYKVSGKGSSQVQEKYDDQAEWNWNASNCWWEMTRHTTSNNNCSLTAKFKKGEATKIYIRASINCYGARWSIAQIYVSKTLPSSWSDRGTPYFYLLNNGSVTSNIPEQTFEHSLDDIGADDVFYISWFKCGTYGYVKQIYFDKPALIVP